jgi:hypothetical protein
VSGWPRRLQLVYVGFAALVIGGAAGIVAGLAIGLLALRIAAVLMVTGIVGMFLTRLIAGIVVYRQTMRRPWPKVPPIEDDDDW